MSPGNGAPPLRRHGRARHAHGVLCLSVPEEDIAHMDDMIAELQRRGVVNASRSWLVRRMLASFDIDTVADPQLRRIDIELRKSRAMRIAAVARREKLDP